MYGSFVRLGTVYEECSLRQYLQHYSWTTRTTETDIAIGKYALIKYHQYTVSSINLLINGKSRFDQLATA